MKATVALLVAGVVPPTFKRTVRLRSPVSGFSSGVGYCSRIPRDGTELPTSSYAFTASSILNR